MSDESTDRDYQAGRVQLNRDIDRGIAGVLAGIGAGFHVLNRIQWSTPWPSAPARSKRSQAPKRAGLA